MIVPEARCKRSAVTVPASDGYHFGDDHTWGTEEQDSLVSMLDMASEKLAEFTEAERAQAADA